MKRNQGDIGIPGKRWPAGRPMIRIGELKHLLDKLDDSLCLALPLRGTNITLLDQNGFYIGYLNLTSKSIRLWKETI